MPLKIPYLFLFILLTSNLYGVNTLSIFGLPSNQYNIEKKDICILGKNEINEIIWSISYITNKQYKSIPFWVEKRQKGKLKLIPRSILYNYYGEKRLEELDSMSNSINFKDTQKLWQEAQLAIHNYLKILDHIWITTVIAKEGPIIHMLGIKGDNIQSKAFYIKQNSTDLDSTIISLKELERITNQNLFPKIKNKLKKIRSTSSNTLIAHESLKGPNYNKPKYIPENPKLILIYKDSYLLNILKPLYLDNLINKKYIKNIDVDKTVLNIKPNIKFGTIIIILLFLFLYIIKKKKRKYINNQIIFNLRKISKNYKSKIKKNTLNCLHPPISISYKKIKHKHYSHIIKVTKERNDGETWKFEAYEGNQKKRINQKLNKFKNENDNINLEKLTILSSENKSLNTIIDIYTWGLLADFPPYRRFHIHMDEKYVVVTVVTTPDKSDEKLIQRQLDLCDKIMKSSKVKKQDKKGITQVVF